MSTLPVPQAPVAGVVRARCECCAEPSLLLNHVQLGGTRMFCAATRRTYLDRGDGLFQPDGATVDAAVVTQAHASAPTTIEADVLSDRPTRTADKVRISLERATFA